MERVRCEVGSLIRDIRQVFNKLRLCMLYGQLQLMNWRCNQTKTKKHADLFNLINLFGTQVRRAVDCSTARATASFCQMPGSVSELNVQVEFTSVWQGMTCQPISFYITLLVSFGRNMKMTRRVEVRYDRQFIINFEKSWVIPSQNMSRVW